MNKARITVYANQYTQLNTNPSDYLAQNLTPGRVGVIPTDTIVQPLATDAPIHEMERHDAIGNQDIVGYLWGIALDTDTADIGLTEGS